MDRNEFLKKLKEALSEYVDKSIVVEQLDYYDKYISDEVAKGRSEKDVIVELGDPRLLAKTIKTVSGSSNAVNDYYEETKDGSSANQRSSQSGSQNGKRYVYSTSGIGCVIVGLVVFVLFMLLLRILSYVLVGTTGLIFGLGPIGIIVLLLIFYFFTRRR